MCIGIYSGGVNTVIDTSGKRIRGKIEPFKDILDPKLKNAITGNGIEYFREYLKDAIALRLQYTLYNPVQISNECIAVINNYVDNKVVFSFVKCCLNYYCNKKQHIISSLKTSCSSFKSKDEHKSLQHAKQDCLECSKHYTNAIKKYFNEYDNNNTILICTNIDGSIRFVSKYISDMLEGNLPKSIKNSTYNSISTKYDDISKIYTFNKTNETYSLAKKNCTYQSIPLEIATEIFCSCYSF